MFNQPLTQQVIVAACIADQSRWNRCFFPLRRSESLILRLGQHWYANITVTKVWCLHPHPVPHAIHKDDTFSHPCRSDSASLQQRNFSQRPTPKVQKRARPRTLRRRTRRNARGEDLPPLQAAAAVIATVTTAVAAAAVVTHPPAVALLTAAVAAVAAVGIQAPRRAVTLTAQVCV